MQRQFWARYLEQTLKIIENIYKRLRELCFLEFIILVGGKWSKYGNAFYGIPLIALI